MLFSLPFHSLWPIPYSSYLQRKGIYVDRNSSRTRVASREEGASTRLNGCLEETSSSSISRITKSLFEKALVRARRRWRVIGQSRNPKGAIGLERSATYVDWSKKGAQSTRSSSAPEQVAGDSQSYATVSRSSALRSPGISSSVLTAADLRKEAKVRYTREQDKVVESSGKRT